MSLPVRVIAWELTRRCVLKCKHCRGASQNCSYEGELTTDEICRTIDSIVSVAKPMLILTGGEPMFRNDLATIAGYATQKGLRCVMAPCGIFASVERLVELKTAGVQMMSLSIDAPTAAEHDAFRGVDGAFKFVIDAIESAKKAGMPFQINTAVSKATCKNLRAMRDFAIEHGAMRIDYFFLVPVGRGKEIADAALSPEETDGAIKTILELDNEGLLPTHITCAPRVVQLATENPHKSPVNGCLGGGSFVFISHRGDLQPCGFFDAQCGNLRDFDFDFIAAYEQSELFKKLRSEPYSSICKATRI